jgi:hypothetical protein
MAKRPKEQIERAMVERTYQGILKNEGLDYWDLRLVLDSGGGEEVAIATLARFKKRGHLKPEVRRRVIEAAREALRGAGFIIRVK